MIKQLLIRRVTGGVDRGAVAEKALFDFRLA